MVLGALSIRKAVKLMKIHLKVKNLYTPSYYLKMYSVLV